MIIVDTCLLNCCINHGLPQDCLEEETETKKISRYNGTHHIIRIVRSEKCLRYKSIMQDCKSSCIDGLSANKSNGHVHSNIVPRQSFSGNSVNMLGNLFCYIK